MADPMTVDCILLVDGRRVDAADLIGSGIDGFIIRNGGHVLKTPKLFGRLLSDGTIEADSENDIHLNHLELEKQAYERLRGVPGVAKCIECTSNGILLKYYRNGALSEYISCHKPPSMPWRWRWVLQATEIIALCHQRGVLVFDIALRNFLLADDFSLRIIDFANSSLVPQSVDITEANLDGCTARLDLFHLANVIYSIMTWQTFSVDCAMESEWPTIDQIPDLEGLDFGQIIHACWNREYTTIQEFALEIRLCAKTSSSAGLLESQNQCNTQAAVSDRSSSPVLPPA